MKNSNGLGNADEREHNRARIMPLSHCMTNSDNRLLKQLAEKSSECFDGLSMTGT